MSRELKRIVKNWDDWQGGKSLSFDHVTWCPATSILCRGYQAGVTVVIKAGAVSAWHCRSFARIVNSKGRQSGRSNVVNGGQSVVYAWIVFRIFVEALQITS